MSSPLCTLEPAQVSATRAEQGHQATVAGSPTPLLGQDPAPVREETPLRGRDHSQAPHRVHVEEERVVLLAGVQAFNGVHQAWVGVVEVRMGDEHRCIWARTRTP